MSHERTTDDEALDAALAKLGMPVGAAPEASASALLAAVRAADCLDGTTAPTP